MSSPDYPGAVQKPIYRFRDIRIEPATRELWRDGARVPLPTKSFDCLTYLIEHRDRAVGRDELIAAVWGRTEVSDKVLGQTLLRARRAIGDASAEQTAIRTLPRFGYHWDEAVVVEVSAAASAAAASNMPAHPVSRRVSSRTPLAVAAAILIVLSALAAAVRYRMSAPTAAPIHSESSSPLVLVLPVAGSHTGEETWVRLGAMDYLAAQLRRVEGLQVLPSEQAVALYGRDNAVDPLGENSLYRLEQITGASYILAPRATRTGSSWNVTLDAYHGRGTQAFEAQAPTSLEAIAQVADRFAASLGLKTSGLRGLPATPSEYLQRIDAAVLAGDMPLARDLADAAPAELKSEPAFLVRAGRIAYRSGDVDRTEQILRPLARADAALPQEIRAQATLVLGSTSVYRQDYDAAERYYTEAIALLDKAGAPAALGRAYLERSIVYGVTRRVDAAVSDFGRARVELERAGDRLGMANLDVAVGLVEVFRNRLADAVAAYDRSIATFTRFDVNDNLVIALTGKSSAQRKLLDMEGALATTERQMAIAEHLQNPMLVRHILTERVPALIDAGRLGEADALIQRYLPTTAKAADAPVFAVLRARLRAVQGRPEDALREADAVLDSIEREPTPGGQIYLSAATDTYVDAALRGGRVDEANRFLDRLRASRDLPQDDDRPFVLELGTARVQAARGDPAAAAGFRKALVLANGLAPQKVVAVAVAHAGYLLGRGELLDAPALLGYLVPYVGRDYDATRTAARLYAALGDDDLAERASAGLRTLAGERTP